MSRTARPEPYTYEIAGISLEILPPRRDLEQLLNPNFQKFSYPATAEHRVYLEELEEAGRNPFKFYIPSKFSLEGDGEEYTLICQEKKNVLLGKINLKNKSAIFRLPPKNHSWRSPNEREAVSRGINYFLEACVQVFLLPRDGTLIHATGLERQGRGYLFLGESGAGKSTIARMLTEGRKEVKLFNDDLMALAIREGAVYLHSTPWTSVPGTTVNPGEVPLSLAFILRKGTPLHFEPVAKNLKVDSLLPHMPWMGRSQEMAQRYLEVSSTICQRVPIYYMWFSPEDQPWEEIEKLTADYGGRED